MHCTGRLPGRLFFDLAPRLAYLARAIGPEAAAALPRLAMAAKAMKAPIADVVGLMEQMNDNLGISADQAPAAFDMIQKGTEGTRTTAAGATKGLADLSLQMRGLGESGEKGLRSAMLPRAI